jgi:ferredoxin
MSFSDRIQRIKVKNVDPTGKTPLLDLINNQIRGTVNDEGEPIREVNCQCRGGFCGMCKIKVVDGEYVMSDDAFKELCLDPQEALSCSTKVLSEEITVEISM